MTDTPTQLLEEARALLTTIQVARGPDLLTVKSIGRLIEQATEQLEAADQGKMTLRIEGVPVAFRSLAEVMAACGAEPATNPKPTKD
jgi:hypothetical protein